MKNGSLDIVCQKCGSCAQFHAPFQFFTKRKFRTLPEGARAWGDLVVTEVFPSEFTWKKPLSEKPVFHHSYAEKGFGYTLNHIGKVSCTSCNTFHKSEIKWPDAAYWRWKENRSEIVARNLEHAIDIYKFLSSEVRTPSLKPSLRSLTTQNMKRSTSNKIARAMALDLMEAIS